MKIVLIYEKFISRGGMEGYLRSLAENLIAAGHDLTILTTRTDEVTRALPVEFVTLPRGGRGGRRLGNFARATAAWVDKSHGSISIGFGRTYAHDVHRAGGGCHRVYSRQLPFWKRWSPKNLRELALESRLYTGEETRFFVVNSHLVARQLREEYGVSEERLRVIHTAVDPVKFSPSTDLARDRAACGLGEKSRAFLFVSMNHERKGLGTLLQIWDRAPGILWVAGPRLKGQFQKMARRLGTKVLAWGEHADLPLLYRSADWFLHPTQYDACANTVLQSLSAGLPGLISAHDGAAEFIREGENGWILSEPRDEAQILAIVKRMAETSAEVQTKMRTQARATVLPLTWAAHVRAWEDLCLSLTAGDLK